MLATLHDGAWDDALRAAQAFIAECERGSPHRAEQTARMLRAKICFARDDVESGKAECERALALARDFDLHLRIDALSELVEVYADAGLIEESRYVAGEILSHEPKAASGAVVSLAWAADLIGLDKSQLESLLEEFPRHNAWRPIAELMLAERWEDVADLALEIGVKGLGADARVRAGEALLASGRVDEAREQLGKALAFYRSVRATRLIRETEALLADAVPAS
jgi:tetratricopeptide (TPR) repeat protein